MLSIPVKKLLIKSIPLTVTIDGATLELQKSFGKTALNNINSPTINFSIIAEDRKYYRSIDDNRSKNGNIITESDIRTAILQYKIGASSKKLTTVDSIKKTASNLYSLSHTPVLNINNIGSFKKDIDYKLLNDHETLSWLTQGPALGTDFNINYDWLEDGYWIAYGIAEYMMQDILTNLRYLLIDYGVNILKVDNVVDLSAIYTDQAFSACSFDVQITYPYSWSKTLSEEDDVTLESIALDLIVNGYDAGTIHVPDI